MSLRPDEACSYRNLRGFTICDNKFEALSIGPATSCGKKATKVANDKKSVVGFKRL